MKTTIVDLCPLKEYFNENITPHELADLLDELSYDYSRFFMLAHLPDFLGGLEDTEYIYAHEKSESFLYNLRKLRDVLRNCVEINEIRLN